MNWELLAAFVIPVAIWLACVIALPRNISWAFDPGEREYSFLPLLDRYLAIFRWLWVGGIALTVLGVASHQGHIVLFAASAVCALLFQILIVNFYESYLHHQLGAGKAVYTPKPYTTSRYAAVISMGASSAIFFIIALMLAVSA